jgi:hypothetical protein
MQRAREMRRERVLRCVRQLQHELEKYVAWSGPVLNALVACTCHGFRRGFRGGMIQCVVAKYLFHRAWNAVDKVCG